MSIIPTDCITKGAINGSSPFEKDWFNSKAYFTDEALRSDIDDALKPFNGVRTDVHQTSPRVGEEAPACIVAVRQKRAIPLVDDEFSRAFQCALREEAIRCLIVDWF